MARKFVWITLMMSALTLGASAAGADEGQRPHHGKMFGDARPIWRSSARTPWATTRP